MAFEICNLFFVKALTWLLNCFISLIICYGEITIDFKQYDVWNISGQVNYYNYVANKRNKMEHSLHTISQKIL